MCSRSGLAAFRFGDGALKAAAAAVLVLIGLTACMGTTPKEEPVTPQPGEPPETWRSVLNLDATKEFYGVTWSASASRFVAVGGIRGIGGVIMYSADGVNWTEATRTSNWLAAVTHSESLGRFVAVGWSTVMYSADGVNWSEGTGGTAGSLSGVTWSEAVSGFFAVGEDILYSTDGESWSMAASSGASTVYDLAGVAWSDALSRYVAVGYGVVLASP